MQVTTASVDRQRRDVNGESSPTPATSSPATQLMPSPTHLSNQLQPSVSSQTNPYYTAHGHGHDYRPRE